MALQEKRHGTLTATPQQAFIMVEIVFYLFTKESTKMCLGVKFLNRF